MSISWSEFSVVFGLGLLCGVLGAIGWRLLWGYVQLRRTQEAVEATLHSLVDDPRDLEAQAQVEACKQRLRWQLTLNPNWFNPLIEETPALVQAIAEVYYPDAEDPLRAPGLSHFMRAIHLASGDIADFLQHHRLGRLVDVSAYTLWKSWEMGQKIVRHERVKTLHKWYRYAYPWYRRALPMWQIVRYQSPWMWMSFTASNLAIRTMQPIVIDIIARRAIELYSGRLALQARQQALKAAAEHPDPMVP
jgi:hypothetical protein